ncbi:MAG: hypothetical protein EBZ16_02915 [Flavobacteriia bacterium]|nr:hypothetical protein [Flavobacteriia bacterium]
MQHGLEQQGQIHHVAATWSKVDVELVFLRSPKQGLEPLCLVFDHGIVGGIAVRGQKVPCCLMP